VDLRLFANLLLQMAAHKTRIIDAQQRKNSCFATIQCWNPIQEQVMTRRWDASGVTTCPTGAEKERPLIRCIP